MKRYSPFGPPYRVVTALTFPSERISVAKSEGKPALGKIVGLKNGNDIILCDVRGGGAIAVVEIVSVAYECEDHDDMM